jgi:hypothetical protein
MLVITLIGLVLAVLIPRQPAGTTEPVPSGTAHGNVPTAP